MVALAAEQTLTDKVLAGERISAEEALELYRLPLAELIRALVRRERPRVDLGDQRRNLDVAVLLVDPQVELHVAPVRRERVDDLLKVPG